MMITPQSDILMPRGTKVILSQIINTIGIFKTSFVTQSNLTSVCNENQTPRGQQVGGLPWVETVQALKIEQELLPQQPTQCRIYFLRINNWVWGNLLHNYHRSF